MKLGLPDAAVAHRDAELFAELANRCFLHLVVVTAVQRAVFPEAARERLVPLGASPVDDLLRRTATDGDHSCSTPAGVRARPREIIGVRVMNPFFSRARRWSPAARHEAQPK